MIAKQLTAMGQMLTHYLQACTFAYTSFASPAFNGLNPFQLVYSRFQNVLLEIKLISQEGTSGSFKEYYKILRKRFAYFQKTVQDYRFQQLDMINKNKPMIQYKQGDLVNLISAQPFLFKTSSRNFKVIYIEPLIMQKMMDKFEYILIDIEGKILNGIFHFIRLM